MQKVQEVSGGNRDALMQARRRKRANRAARPVLVGRELQAHLAREAAALRAWQQERSATAAAAAERGARWW